MLKVLQLASCVGVTNNGFKALTDRLSELMELHCTGNDRSSGSLTDEALRPLTKDGALPHLARLYVTDQARLDFLGVPRLIRARKGLRVLAGETDSDSAAWGCVLSQMGRDYGDGLYGNMEGVGGGCGGYDDGYGGYGSDDVYGGGMGVHYGEDGSDYGEAEEYGY